ncbi:myrosinase 1-like, partial [Rhodnius prolixus]|uniref:myrosinase 1-like n=1 Tax=Rhodnius prolixus TaxID=13249 RepID=UPI003D18ADED
FPGSYHFLGINHYTSVLCTTGESGRKPSWERDSDVLLYVDPSWPRTGTFWQRIVPQGFGGLLNWLKIQYDNLPTFVIENGCGTENYLEDDIRITYYKLYMNQIVNAIYKDGCKVFGYTAWCLMDDFEWMNGYVYRFGFISVNFSDPNRPRTKRKSASFIKRLIESNKCSWSNEKS